MKRIFCMLALVLTLSAWASPEQHLVILTTNDTHSQIDPDFDGKGGVLRRRALIDSVRGAERFVLLCDAGDAVQGTLYFTLFGGEVETALIDSLGYDVCTLGNHEFDNGMESLARNYSRMSTPRVSANYDFTCTPLEGLFVPYIVKEYGGRRIAVMGINLLPEGMIAPANCEGIVYSNSAERANSLASQLKSSGEADFVIALTHVGYKGGNDRNPSDVDIVAGGSDIDLVIGGHSHTVVNPADAGSEAWKAVNALGREIPVTQTGAQGKNVGYIVVDLDSLRVTEYKLLPVDKRWDSRAQYAATVAWLAPYKASVDSLMNTPIIHSTLSHERGSAGIENFTADAVLAIARQLHPGHIDMSLMNRGGIRQPMPCGDVSEGVIRSMYPFDNRLVVLEISGERLLESLKIMATRGGDPVSAGVEVEYIKEAGSKAEIKSATIDGVEIDPSSTYTVATIDYLANGGDYMTPLTDCERLYEDESKIGDRIVEYIKTISARGEVVDPSIEPRMVEVR